MNISEIVSKIELEDTSLFFDFTKKWIGYVTSKTGSAAISDNDWAELFGKKNPVAGINWGEMTEEASFATKEGKITKKTNEQSSFKGKWDSDIRPAIEAAINVKDSSEKLQKIKDLNQCIQKIITDGGGRDRTTAINRILTTFFPDLFVTIPQSDKLSEFIDSLQQKIVNGSTIIKADNWIDNSYQVKRFLDNELGDKKLTASAWRFYDYLAKNPKVINATNVNTKATTSMDKNKYDDFQKLLLGNYNLILTGAPGTGKTYLAKRIAEAIGASEDSIRMVQFHPSYDYTDFVEGLRPIKDGSTLGFQRKDGIFKDFCKKALEAANYDRFEDGYTKLIEAIKLAGANQTKYYCSTLGSDNHQFELTLNQTLNQTNGEIVFHRASTNTQAPKSDLKKLFYFYANRNQTDVSNEGRDEMEKQLGRKLDYTNWRGILQKIIDLSAASAQIHKERYVFIIDEINRGEASKIFGELFYAIDPGYRGKKGKVDTQYQNLIPKEGDADFDPKNADVFRNGFYVPENVYIIGTMNDIDRSVESMDFAMRRRFAWKEITAKSRQSMLDEDEAWGSKGKPSEEVISELKIRMDNLNDCIIDQYGSEEFGNKDKVGLTKAYQVGAAYFLKYTLYNDFEELWTNHLEGLLYEYLRGKPNIDEKIKRLHQAYNDTTAH